MSDSGATAPPRVWVRCASGRMFAQPSDALLRDLVEAVHDGREDFLIAENLDDATGRTYLQTTLDDDHTFVVEHRDGRADRHFRAKGADRAAVHATMVGWRSASPGWDGHLAWSPLTLDAP